MRMRVPMEVPATVLAASTVFIGGPTANMPTWGIFLGWAATVLCGGPTYQNCKKLWLTMVTGSAFGLITVGLTEWLSPTAVSNGVPVEVLTAGIVLLVNPCLLLLGRTQTLSLVPGMFIGFSSMLASYYGHFGYAPGNLWAAALCGIAMNMLGPLFALVTNRLSTKRHAPESTDAKNEPKDSGPLTVGNRR